jgi:hypothetical protein
MSREIFLKKKARERSPENAKKGGKCEQIRTHSKADIRGINFSKVIVLLGGEKGVSFSITP